MACGPSMQGWLCVWMERLLTEKHKVAYKPQFGMIETIYDSLHILMLLTLFAWNMSC